MLKSLWLVRPRPDGGCDYVSFEFNPTSRPSAVPAHASACTVEMLEGSHLPPQMPLLKRRHRLNPAEADRFRVKLQNEGGFHRSEPLF